MKALTLWQPWASLVIAGAKPFEWRRWVPPRALIGQRIVIHAGARKARREEILDLWRQVSAGEPGTALDAAIALDLLDRWMTAPAMLPLASGLGTAVLGEARSARVLHGAGKIVADSDRIDQHVYGWPLTDIHPFEPIVPCRGFQGFWDWPFAAETPPPK